MFLPIGAAAVGAIDLLSSLTSSLGSSAKTGVKQSSDPFSLLSSGSSTSTQPSGNSSQGGRLSSDTFNALLASLDSNQSSTPMTRADALKDLFARIDGNGDGSISKAEFEDKLGAGGTNTAAADNVFAKLDTDGDGSVSPNELAAALKPKSGGHHHAHGAGGKSGSGGDDALMQALSGASSTSATNSDGSTTTTLTYADGTKITMTSPAASSGGSTNAGAASSATSSYNLVEQLVQKQAQALTTAAQQSVSLKV